MSEQLRRALRQREEEAIKANAIADELAAACRALLRRMDVWARSGNPPQAEDKAAMQEARAALIRHGTPQP